jgi:hypothetical protein
MPARSAALELAQAFIKALSDPAARDEWKAGGLESLAGGG